MITCNAHGSLVSAPCTSFLSIILVEILFLLNTAVVRHCNISDLVNGETVKPPVHLLSVRGVSQLERLMHAVGTSWQGFRSGKDNTTFHTAFVAFNLIRTCTGSVLVYKLQCLLQQTRSIMIPRQKDPNSSKSH